MKLENSIQDNKTIQNLKFNTETKLVRGGPCADPAPEAGGGVGVVPAPRPPLLPAGPSSVGLPTSLCLHVWPKPGFLADKTQVCPEREIPGLSRPALAGFLRSRSGPCSRRTCPQRMEETASLRDSIMRLRSEEGPWSLRLGSRGVLTPLGKQRSFVKDAGPGDAVPVNHWGVYQAVRWAVGSHLLETPRPGVWGGPGEAPRPGGMSRVSGQVAAVEGGPHEPGGPAEAERVPGEVLLPRACTPAHIRAPFPEINGQLLSLLESRAPSQELTLLLPEPSQAPGPAPSWVILPTAAASQSPSCSLQAPSRASWPRLGVPWPLPLGSRPSPSHLCRGSREVALPALFQGAHSVFAHTLEQRPFFLSPRKPLLTPQSLVLPPAVGPGGGAAPGPARWAAANLDSQGWSGWPVGLAQSGAQCAEPLSPAPPLLGAELRGLRARVPGAAAPARSLPRWPLACPPGPGKSLPQLACPAAGHLGWKAPGAPPSHTP